VADETVFVGSHDTNLYAVDAATGDEQWAFKTGDIVFSSPTVAGETVYVGGIDSNFYAVDTTTGEQKWAFKSGDAIQSSPTVVDGTVFIGSVDNNLYALDTGVEGSSEGSRVNLGTLGHHGEWQYADQSITSSEESERSESAPGFGIGSGIAAFGATGYMLRRRLTDDSA
jgi:PGF-CTERM protein